MAFAVTAMACPLVLRAIRHRVLDEPNARSLHHTSTPRGGGLAIAAGALAGIAVASELPPWRAPLLAAAIGFGILGLVDDLRRVPALTRLVAQLIVSALVLPALVQDLTGPVIWKVSFSAGALLWLVAYVNAFNFMDGINGISAVQALLAGVAWALIGQIEDVPVLVTAGLIIAGCAAAFAPFNVPRARMFLGDVGSYFIGGWLAVLVVVGLRSGLPPEAVVAPVAIALADTLSTIVRRLRRHETLHEAHSDHTYQRLVHAGWSHTTTSVYVGALVLAASALGASTVAFARSPVRGLADLAIMAIIAGYLYSPRLLASPARGAAPVQ